MTIVSCITSYAQDVSILSIGSGNSRSEALTDALRSAIGQAFGVFISTNTTVLNDSIIKDEIIQISNGNVKNYEIIDEFSIDKNLYTISVKATVSVDKLRYFSEQKGFKVEFQGGLFAANIKLQELNELNEQKAIDNLYSVVSKLIANSIDFEIKVGEPKISTIGRNNGEENYFLINDGYLTLGKWELPVSISAKANSNIENAYSFLVNTLKNISMVESERISYNELNKQYSTVLIGQNNCSGLFKILPNTLYYKDNNRKTTKYESNLFQVKLSKLNIPGYSYVIKFGNYYKDSYSVLDSVLFLNDFNSVSKTLDSYFEKFKGKAESVKVLGYDPSCLNPIYSFRNKSTVLKLINMVQNLKMSVWNFILSDGINEKSGISMYSDFVSYSYSKHVYRLDISKGGFNPFVLANRDRYYGCSENQDICLGSIFFSESDSYFARRIKEFDFNDVSYFEFPFNYFEDWTIVGTGTQKSESLYTKFPFLFLSNSMFNLHITDYRTKNIPSYDLVLDLSCFKKDRELITFNFFQFFTTNELEKVKYFKVFPGKIKD